MARLFTHVLSANIPEKSEIKHPLKDRRPTIETRVVWSNDRGNGRLEDSQTFCDQPDTMVVEWVPLDAGSVLIRIAELAKDVRRPPIEFPLLRHHKPAH